MKFFDAHDVRDTIIFSLGVQLLGFRGSRAETMRYLPRPSGFMISKTLKDSNEWFLVEGIVLSCGGEETLRVVILQRVYVIYQKTFLQY